MLYGIRTFLPQVVTLRVDVSFRALLELRCYTNLKFMHVVHAFPYVGTFTIVSVYTGGFVHVNEHKAKETPVAAVYTVMPTQPGWDACAPGRHS